LQVTLEVPLDLAQRFAGDAEGLSRAALEALALEGVRSGKLTAAQARRLLGIKSRMKWMASSKSTASCFLLLSTTFSMTPKRRSLSRNEG
jgi:hypothetical protein